MPPIVALALCILGIIGLFWLDRERNARLSGALWLPTLWLLIAGSRHVSEWFGVAPTVSVEQYLEGSPLDATIYAGLLALSFIVLWLRRQKVARLLRQNWPILLFIFYCAISIAWSDYASVAVKRWIKSLGDYAVILIMLTEIDRGRAIKRVIGRVAFLLLPISILVIKYYPAVGRSYAQHWTGTQFFVGVTETKNMLGMVCLVFGFVSCWRVLEAWNEPMRKRIRVFVVHGTVCAMAVWLLIMSDSKTSLSCFVLACGLVAAHKFSRVARKRTMVHAMTAFAIVASFSVLFLGFGSGALETMGRDATLTGRTEIWRILLKAPVNPFLGTGFESFWLGKRLTYLWTFPIMDGINEAHNGYLETYLNLGLAGVALIALLLATGYGNVLRLLSRDPEAGRLRLGLFVIAVIYNFTEAGIRSSDPIWIVLLLAIFVLPERARLQSFRTDRMDLVSVSSAFGQVGQRGCTRLALTLT